VITAKELKVLARTMHSLGIISLKTPEIELLIQPNPPKVGRKRSNPMLDTPDNLNAIPNSYSAVKDVSKGFGGYTEDQILSWSSSVVEEDNAEDKSEV
jgi:hypothetical protein